MGLTFKKVRCCFAHVTKVYHVRRWVVNTGLALHVRGALLTVVEAMTEVMVVGAEFVVLVADMAHWDPPFSCHHLRSSLDSFLIKSVAAFCAALRKLIFTAANGGRVDHGRPR